MESLFFDVLKRLMDEHLAPMLLGGLAAIVYLNFHLKMPEYLQQMKARIIRIEKRQKITISILEDLVQQRGSTIDLERLESLIDDSNSEDNSEEEI